MIVAAGTIQRYLRGKKRGKVKRVWGEKMKSGVKIIGRGKKPTVL